MIKLINKKEGLLILATSAFFSSFAKGTNNAETITISTNALLLIVAFVLLGIILLLISVVSKAIDAFKEKIKNNAKIVSTLVLIFFSSYMANAQSTNTENTNEIISNNAITLLLITIIIMEIGIIVYLIKQIAFLTGINALQKKVSTNSEVVSLWDKINSFKPLSQEKDIDLGHSYDGIRELDNIAPPWFTIGFVFTILFSIVYLYRYHVSETAPLQIQEYENAVLKAKNEKEAREKLMPPKKVDENNLTLLSDAEIAKGKELFIKNCATCHANDGGGGAGPNLTDEYWIHGGSLKDIYITIRDGYTEKAMPSWSGLLNPQQIEQITSYVKSLKGTQPMAPKEKQGELYKEKVTANSSIIIDSNTTANK